MLVIFKSYSDIICFLKTIYQNYVAFMIRINLFKSENFLEDFFLKNYNFDGSEDLESNIFASILYIFIFHNPDSSIYIFFFKDLSAA